MYCECRKEFINKYYRYARHGLETRASGSKTHPIILSKLVILLFILVILPPKLLLAQKLPLPSRKSDAVSGSVFKNIINNLPPNERDNIIYKEIISGNVPSFLRDLVAISFSKTIQDSTFNVVYWVIPEYLSVGSNNNYFLLPLKPTLAQKIANTIDYLLPTNKWLTKYGIMHQ